MCMAQEEVDCSFQDRVPPSLGRLDEESHAERVDERRLLGAGLLVVNLSALRDAETSQTSL